MLKTILIMLKIVDGVELLDLNINLTVNILPSMRNRINIIEEKNIIAILIVLTF